MIHHPAANGAPCDNHEMEPFLCRDPAGGPYAFNLICMAALFARWLNQVGVQPLFNRYNIASWPWETQQWPNAWKPLVGLVDELWPSSSFTASALSGLSASANLPLDVFSMSAQINNFQHLTNPQQRRNVRKKYGLPNDSIVFVFAFDFNSTAIRKNPKAALDVFQSAFPLPHLPLSLGRDFKNHLLSQKVSLVIKTTPPNGLNPDWYWLCSRSSEDSRIT